MLTLPTETVADLLSVLVAEAEERPQDGGTPPSPEAALANLARQAEARRRR